MVVLFLSVPRTGEEVIIGKVDTVAVELVIPINVGVALSDIPV